MEGWLSVNQAAEPPFASFVASSPSLGLDSSGRPPRPDTRWITSLGLGPWNRLVVRPSHGHGDARSGNDPWRPSLFS